MGSRRFPGKAMAEIAGKPSVYWTVSRARASGFPVVLATTDAPEDAVLEGVARLAGVGFFRGPEHAARRMLMVCEAEGASHVIRVTGDDIFVDPDLMRRAVEMHIQHGSDYTTMPAVSRGWDSEVISRHALELASQDPEPEMLGLVLSRLDIKRFVTALSTPFKPPMELNTEEDMDRIREYVSARTEALSV